MTNVKYTRGNTWPFTFKKRTAPSTSYDDLNGYQVFFTIRKQVDETDTDDSEADYSDDIIISTPNTLSTTFTVNPASTINIKPGTYIYSFKWKKISDGSILSSDDTFDVIDTITNRST